MTSVNCGFMVAAMDDMTAFELLCRELGPYSAIGAIFDPPVSPQAVGKWAEKGIPPERVIELAKATGFRVTPHRMRPDIYPLPTDGIPQEAARAAA